MEGRRAPQGLEAEERLAFGLTAVRLCYLLFAVLSAYGVLHAQLPLSLRLPFAALLAAVGVTLAWGRIAGRHLDRWLVLLVAFYVRPRHSPDTVRAAGAGRGAWQRLRDD